MSNNSNVQRGQWWERKFAERIGGYKVSMNRRSGPDVVKRKRPLYLAANVFEVKRLAKGMQMLQNFIDQAKDEGANAVAIRIGRRKQWIVVQWIDDDDTIWEPSWRPQ